MSTVKVAIVGYKGRMGSLVSNLLSENTNYEIVANIGRDDDLDAILQQCKPDVAFELTSNVSVFYNAKTIIKNKVRPLIGASGLDITQIEYLTNLCQKQGLGGLIIPNFSLGIALINKMALDLQAHFADFAILEYHHSAKKDKPSGTARYLAHILRQSEQDIASIRGNGFLAKLQLYVNTPYERLIIDHESFDRKSFTPGILLALTKIMYVEEMLTGLEKLL